MVSAATPARYFAVSCQSASVRCSGLAHADDDRIAVHPVRRDYCSSPPVRVAPDAVLGGRDQLERRRGGKPLADQRFGPSGGGPAAWCRGGTPRWCRPAPARCRRAPRNTSARARLRPGRETRRSVRRSCARGASPRCRSRGCASVRLRNETSSIVLERLEEIAVRDVGIAGTGHWREKLTTLPRALKIVSEPTNGMPAARSRSFRCTSWLAICRSGPSVPPNSAICSRMPFWTVSTALNTDSMCRARIRAVLASSRWFSIRTCSAESTRPGPSRSHCPPRGRRPADDGPPRTAGRPAPLPPFRRRSPPRRGFPFFSSFSGLFSPPLPSAPLAYFLYLFFFFFLSTSQSSLLLLKPNFLPLSFFRFVFFILSPFRRYRPRPEGD